MSAMTCSELSDAAAELALGSLTGVERARALDHLDRCDTCSRLVAELALTADRLIELAPGAEPPVGFENRVLERLAPPAPVRRRRTWIPAAAAAAVVAAAASWLVGDVTRPAPAPSPAAASLIRADLMAAGRPVGTVFSYRSAPAWVYMNVELPGTTGWVTCELVRADGSTVRLGSFELHAGDGYWGAPTGSGGDHVSGARLIAANGAVLATATFPRSA